MGVNFIQVSEAEDWEAVVVEDVEASCPEDCDHVSHVFEPDEGDEAHGGMSAALELLKTVEGPCHLCGSMLEAELYPGDEEPVDCWDCGAVTVISRGLGD